MKIIADENVEATVVEWLRGLGHEVYSVAQSASSLSDVELMRFAHESGGIVLTHDLDFGELAYRWKMPCRGVVLARFGLASPAEVLERFQAIWPLVEPQTDCAFIVIKPNAIRVRPLPG